jgi:hypothetical protein
LDHTRIGWAYFGGGIAAGLLLAALIAGLVYIRVNMKKKAGELVGVNKCELGTLTKAHATHAPVWARSHPGTKFSSSIRSTGSAGSVGSLDVKI